MLFRSRLEVRLPALRLGYGLGRGGEFACVGTAAPCFTAYNAKSRIVACSNYLKNLCSQGFSQLLLLCDSRQCTYVPSSREARAWRSRALNSLWSMASPYFLYGTYS